MKVQFVALLMAVSIALMLMGSACAPTRATDHSAYIQEIIQWRSERVQRMCGPTSWLSLIGRIPIQVGTSSVGTLDTNDLHFPGTEAIDIATLHLDSTGLAMWPASENSVLLESGERFQGGKMDLERPPMFHHDALYWTFLERSGAYFLRLWDTLSPARHDLKEIPAYPVDPAWVLDVVFSPADSGTTMTMDDIQGQKRMIPIAGSVSGTWQDTAFTLLAIDDGDLLFIIIEDATTDIETYPGGRYLDIPKADSVGHTVMDFNKAYVPPCAFTEFATCLLPPEENRLPFAVRAGEKTHEH